jgi:hypothetical protein
MNIKERNKRLADFFVECAAILEKKGGDYNPDGVAFSEIKKEAEDLGLRPEQVMLVLAGKHWGAIKTYVKTQKLTTEPIRERLKDLANYMALMAVMLEANKKENKRNEYSSSTGRNTRSHKKAKSRNYKKDSKSSLSLQNRN